MTRTFNVTERVQEHRSAEIVFGEGDDRKVLHPSTETTEQRALVRKLQLEQTVLQVKLEGLAKKETPTKADLQAIDAGNAEAEAIMYRLVSIMLADEAGVNPDPEWLADHVPSVVVIDLIGFLNGETTPDPS